MSRRERVSIRKNTTILSTIIVLLAGIIIFGVSMHLGNTLSSSMWWIILFVLLSGMTGCATWVYETDNLYL